MARVLTVRAWSRRLAGIVTLMAAVSMLALPVRASTGHLRAPGAPGVTLAQAPEGLRAAVGRTLGRPSAAATWSARAELTASGASSFGDAVAISGSTAVVGASATDLNTGSAYVFVNSGGVWSQQAELKASDAATGDNFGGSVAIAGSTVVVGAKTKDSFQGAAYVFAWSGGVWTQRAKLTASDGEGYDQFGWSVAVSGSTAVVTAPFRNGTGAAYVFVRSGSIWTQQAEVTASDGVTDDGFGISVAMSGASMLIGAPYRNSYAGAGYVFTGSGAIWSQEAELTASDGAPNDYFGYGLAISGNTAVMGAMGRNSGTGTAYVFVNSLGTWLQQAELTASDGAHDYFFGRSVAISRTTALVGSANQSYSNGAAYVFVRSGGSWSQQAELTAPDGGHLDHFGGSVSLFRSTALIGANGHRLGRGAAYVFVNA